jgi:hypothetical protein
MLRFRVRSHVAAHVAAPRFDFESVRFGVRERSAHDLCGDSAIAYGAGHLGVMDAHHVADAGYAATQTQPSKVASNRLSAALWWTSIVLRIKASGSFRRPACHRAEARRLAG